LRFAADFDLSNNVILSTIELGDIYLSSIKSLAPGASVRKLNFSEFWETLLRCALVAYTKISDATITDKLRGLFLYMWRSINKSVPRAWADSRRTGTTNAGDLLAGAMLFNRRFTAHWAADGYRDYLSPPTRKIESGKEVLSRLLEHNRAGGGGGLSLSASAGGKRAAAGGGRSGTTTGIKAILQAHVQLVEISSMNGGHKRKKNGKNTKH
jgi:hypothetical protein